METPFGALYTPNISSDKETGIGQWTAGEFYRMLHEGKSRDGSLLYPAMPFASYTKVTRADFDAIYAYLQSVPPIRQPNRPHELRFPFCDHVIQFAESLLDFLETIQRFLMASGQHRAEQHQKVSDFLPGFTHAMKSRNIWFSRLCGVPHPLA